MEWHSSYYRNTNKERTVSRVTRFGISMDSRLLERFDERIRSKGYSNRSEAIRDLIRDSLVEAEWEGGEAETLGTITIVYDHHTREISNALTRLQHDFFRSIVSTTHIHVDEHNCLEVLIVRGKGGEIKRIADRLIGTRGVKHGKLSVTTTGRHLT
jgi:CopG family nickel-responsive transcriptional regulator